MVATIRENPRPDRRNRHRFHIFIGFENTPAKRVGPDVKA
jgi:hypothetical protein